MTGPGLSAEFFALQDALRGEYSLEREIGRGGMGIVYLARDVALDRPVAIKILPPALATNPDTRARFLREARTAAQLSHPNVVPIHRADERAGFAFFVMAWVDGETLGERIHRRGPLSPPVAAKILREVAWALAYANSRGIVHRDVKPDNILLERDTGRALVTDFGIAQLATGSSSQTAAGLVLGSVHFMSPEQAAGERLDGRSDLYSLGAVGYFALTGRLPFEGDSVQAIMAKHITQDLPPLEVEAAGPDLISAVRRALAKRKEERFATGEDFASALAAAQSSESSIPVPLRAWLRPSTVAVALLGSASVVAATFYSETLFSKPESAWLLVVPIALLLGSIVRETRAALAAGFSMDDLRRALRQDSARRAEERRYVDEAGRMLESAMPSWLRGGLVDELRKDRAWKTLVPKTAGDWLTLGVVVVGLVIWELQPRIMGWFGAIFIVWTLFKVATGGTKEEPIPRKSFNWRRVFLLDRQADSGADSGIVDRLRAWFWSSWGGDAIGALARIGLGRRIAPSSSRPTEEVIGLAVADLLETLPKDMRRRFASAKDITQRLENEATALRSRGGQPERLAMVVSALENVRLDLLRLHAGRGDADALEAALHAAEELGREVRRVLEANDESEALLRPSPRPR